MSHPPESTLLNGALAGFVATVPMSAAMLTMHRLLPEHEQYPLPPHEITAELAEKADMEEHLDEPEHKLATTLSHFAYGAASGALYASIAHRLPLAPAVGGALFGLALWTGSYLGWLPAVEILRPATEHPARRNALMIVAHIVWGTITGVVVDQLERRNGSLFPAKFSSGE
ncbi:MAG TPA: DUF6789 family protein [Anaerolineae bacterium]|nr:DUF6789 family protein [Anaerolineae bacterium]